MFRSKKELDIHIRDTMAKISSEKERALRCFSCARAYVSLREFDTARTYLETYLKQSNPPNPAEANKLMGDILVELNDHEKAFEHYKKSYEIGKTRDVLNKVCGLIQNGYGIHESPQSRNQWLKLQESTSTSTNLAEEYDVKAPYIIYSQNMKNFNSPRATTTTSSPSSSGPCSSNKIQPTSCVHHLAKTKSLPKLIESNNKQQQPSPTEFVTGFVGSSTPKKLEYDSHHQHHPQHRLNHDHHQNNDDELDFSGGDSEDVTMELANNSQFENTLEKVLEQNTIILDTISQMEDEIKDLNDRLSMLKKSNKRLVQKKNQQPPPRSVIFDSSSTMSGS